MFPSPKELTHAWYKFYAFVNPEALLMDGVVIGSSEIASYGYPAFSGGCSEIYLEKCFQDAGLAPAVHLPVARVLGERSLMFGIQPCP